MGEQIRQALIDAVETKRLDALRRLVEENKAVNNSKLMVNNTWIRYYAGKKQDITSLQDYIDPTSTHKFNHELQELQKQGNNNVASQK